MGPGTAQVNSIMGLGMVSGAQRCRLGNDNASLETTPVWLTVSLAQVGEDGGA
jgi:hypothetical protein